MSAVTGPTVLGVISGTISVLSFLFSLFPNTNKDGTVVRLQVGLDTPGGLDEAGGHVPFITTYNANFDAIEYSNPKHRTCITGPGGGSTCYNTYNKIKQGSYVDVTLTMSAGHEGQQPAYIDLQQIGDDKSKGDGICLAVVSTTWKDGKQYAWVGDWAKACNVQFWYPSNIYIDNEGHKTACVWLDHDHSDAVPWSALKVHLPDFATKTKHELDWYCKKHPSVIQFHNQGDALYHWNVDKNRELAKTTQISDVAAKPWAPEPDQAKTKRSLSMKRSAVMSSQLVVSKGVQHSAKELCESDTSHGPDFVSEPERLFCDMGTKTLWLPCEGDEDQKPYFDHEAKQLRGVGIVGRDVEGFEYSRVTEWE